MEIVLGGDAGSGDDSTREELRGGDVIVNSPRGLRTAERLLIEALPAKSRGLLTVGDSEGVVALAAKCTLPDADVHHLQIDAYEAARSARCFANHAALPVTLHNFGDLPDLDATIDTILLRGPRESLLLRELIEEAHDALPIGGRLVVTSYLSPQATLDLVKRAFGRADRQSGVRKDTQLISARKTRDKSVHKRRARITERTFRDITLRLEVRPGVFGFKSFDAGTKALIEAMQIDAAAKVIDIGCGAGALGVFAAKLGAQEVTLVDSHSRAVEVCQHNVELNEVTQGTVLQRADLEELPSDFDVALMNPPYYADFRIAKSFVNAALNLLRPGGKAWLVAKADEEHRGILEARFAHVSSQQVGDYTVFLATKTESTGSPNSAGSPKP